MDSTTNVMEHIKAILGQKRREADTRLAEAVSQVDGRLRDINGFSGSQPVLSRRREYEKDIESRRDSFVSVTKEATRVLSAQQRLDLQPALNDLAQKWLGQHIAALEKELRTLAAHLGVANSSVNDLSANQVLVALEIELQLGLGGSDSIWESGENFVDPERLNQLRLVNGTKYDLSRLVRLCEEIDVVFKQGCYHAVAMLTRSILDHVPPIFGVKSFSEVANNYTGSRSFREIAQHLDASSRKIADSHLHTQIRSIESLPTRTQVDERQRMDVLLSEVIRVLAAKARNP